MVAVDLGSKAFSLGWSGSLPAPIVDGDTATYPSAFEGTDLVLHARPAGFEYSLIVPKPPTKPLVLDLPLTLDGVEAAVDQSRNFQVTDDKDRSVAEANPGIMYGAERGPSTDERPSGHPSRLRLCRPHPGRRFGSPPIRPSSRTRISRTPS